MTNIYIAHRDISHIVMYISTHMYDYLTDINEHTNTHKQNTQTRMAPFPLLVKQPTISATENLPVCPALLGTQASPKERGRMEWRERKCRNSRCVMVQFWSGVELENEGSEITKRSGGRKEETDWLADRSSAAFVTSVWFIYGASSKGSQLVLTARPRTRSKFPGFPTWQA